MPSQFQGGEDELTATAMEPTPQYVPDTATPTLPTGVGEICTSHMCRGKGNGRTTVKITDCISPYSDFDFTRGGTFSRNNEQSKAWANIFKKRMHTCF